MDDLYEDNVIDLMEHRLVRSIDNAKSDIEMEVAEALLDMYQSGIIKVTLQDGVLMYQSEEIFGDKEPVFVPQSGAEVQI